MLWLATAFLVAFAGLPQIDPAEAGPKNNSQPPKQNAQQSAKSAPKKSKQDDDDEIGQVDEVGTQATDQ